MILPFKFFKGYMSRYSDRETDPNLYGLLTFPITTRVFSQLLGNELVSVQPLSPPIGQLFYLDTNITIKRPMKDFKLLSNNT